MFIKSNNNYDLLMFSLINEHLPKASLSEELNAFLEMGIGSYNDIFYFKKKQPHAQYDSDVEDKTGIECFNNKIFIEQYTPEKDPDKIFAIGVLFIFLLVSKMFHSGLKGFKLFLSIDIDNHADCNICFHKIRQGETWLLDDLNLYEINAILTIDI